MCGNQGVGSDTDGCKGLAKEKNPQPQQGRHLENLVPVVQGEQTGDGGIA